jgi:aspartyl-tRNA(Asn)/glutamyl-tRNA(Gln) amidotransferase subunit A
VALAPPFRGSADSDPALLTLVSAREQLRGGRLSATELTQAVLDRVERLNGSLNAYLRVDGEAALAQARAADRSRDRRPLAGIPICIKDLIDVAGVPTTAGAAGWQRLPDRDAGAVGRLRGAGAIIVGKGHTNEFAYGIDGRNPHWGNCANPYDPARISGGSSSGPAVATAAGMALAGLGTDTTGSLRVPASFCGLVGVRPTLGLVPSDGVVPLAWSYDSVGPLARDAADAAAMLEILAGEGGSSGRLDWRGQAPVAGLRLGLVEQLLEVTEPYVADGVLRTARNLEAMGARVSPVRIDLLARARAIHMVIQRAEAARAHASWFEAQRPRYSEMVRVRLEAGRLLPASAYLTAQQARRLLRAEVMEKLRGLDALLAPSTPVVAPTQDAETVLIRGDRPDVRDALLNCALLPSQLGCPVVSVPIAEHQGLPFGMQIFGRPFSEPLLLALAGVCETGYRTPSLTRRAIP